MYDSTYTNLTVSARELRKAHCSTLPPEDGHQQVYVYDQMDPRLHTAIITYLTADDARALAVLWSQIADEIDARSAAPVTIKKLTTKKPQNNKTQDISS